jgi:hypothetical protein
MGNESEKHLINPSPGNRAPIDRQSFATGIGGVVLQIDSRVVMGPG